MSLFRYKFILLE